MKFLALLLALFFCIDTPVFAKAKGSAPLRANEIWLKKELEKIGFSKSFISEAMETYEAESFDKTLTLNLLGFLRPAGQHMNLVTDQAVSEATKYIKGNKRAFTYAQKKYRVPPEVIASLIWIETRHGQDVGSFHTLSVYLHLLQADLNKNKTALTRLALVKNKEEQAYTPSELRKLMTERTRKKAKWAREQLIALASARKQKHFDIKTLRGSYAGAFGLPQFIPSSYLAYAKAKKPKAVPNLMKSSDAILSVAYYLSKHGWRNNKFSAKIAALMKYNNSRDYADSILAIAKRVTPTRKLSSVD
ncbi:MAG: lytic murein transglycosylase [Bdellovibrionaceae bacterium]|nr:lytic murein transglycosylase [Pseudobdellovibrionaceae bacterium]